MDGWEQPLPWAVCSARPSCSPPPFIPESPSKQVALSAARRAAFVAELRFPLLGNLDSYVKLATSCWVWRRATTCRPFFHRKPDRAVISSQKPSIQQKSSRGILYGQLLLLISIPALTTQIHQVNGEQRVRQIGCRSIWGAQLLLLRLRRVWQVRHGYCLSFQRLKSTSQWNEVEKEKGDEDMRDRRHRERVGVVIDRLWLTWVRQDCCQSVWSLSQLMRIFNISRVLCAL